MSIYFSQFRQDEFVDSVILNKKRNGYFVDIGAHDGISLSNSYFFERERNFTGLCIEPNPKAFNLLRDNRKCHVLNACIGASVGKVKFLAIEGYSEMLSGIIDHYHPKHLERIDNYISEHGGNKQEIEVDSIPLQNIELLKNVAIDYMSIDTEGNEFTILKSIDFSKNSIKCFTIENNYGENLIEDFFNKNGYIRVYRIGDDDFYLLKKKYTIGFRIRRRLFNARVKKGNNHS